jgi:hypothetical protein
MQELLFVLTLLTFLGMTAPLATVGSISVAKSAEALSTASAYDETVFDFMVVDPSVDQVASLRKESSISSVFPCHVEHSFVNLSNKTYTFLSSPDTADRKIGFFNSQTLIEGNFNSVVVDQCAASELGLSIGSFVDFTFNGLTIKRTISGVALPVYFEKGTDFYGGGVFQFAPTNEEFAKAGEVWTYNLAFIDSNDTEKTQTYLGSYLPYGELMTFEEFKAQYEQTHSQGDNSDSHWLDIEETEYQQVVNEFERLGHADCVLEKQELQKKDGLSQASADTYSVQYHHDLTTGLVVGFIYLVFFIIVFCIDLSDESFYGCGGALAGGAISLLTTWGIMTAVINHQILAFSALTSLVKLTCLLPLVGPGVALLVLVIGVIFFEVV